MKISKEQVFHTYSGNLFDCTAFWFPSKTAPDFPSHISTFAFPGVALSKVKICRPPPEKWFNFHESCPMCWKEWKIVFHIQQWLTVNCGLKEYFSQHKNQKACGIQGRSLGVGGEAPAQIIFFIAKLIKCFFRQKNFKSDHVYIKYAVCAETTE